MEKTFNYQIDFMRNEELVHTENYSNEENFNKGYESIISGIESLESNFIILEGDDFKHRIYIDELGIQKIINLRVKKDEKTI